jgi:hypothetical protein
VSETLLEWNLGFARDEVIAGVEKLFAQLGCAYSRTETDTETRFHAAFSQGTLDLVVQPLTSYRSPFNIQATLHRTLLTVLAAGLSAEAKETLRQRLTLVFLRVGG